MPIRAVLLDFGGVFTASPFGVFADAAAEFQAPADQVLQLVFGPYELDTDHPWHRLERGEMPLGEARDAIMALAREAGIALDPLLILARMADGSGVREAVVDITRRLRSAGLRTALVTNNVREFRASWQAMLPDETLFDAVIDSSEVGVRKPNPAIFAMALEAVGDVAPDQAIFLDDFEGNVAAARRCGLHALRVDDDPAPALAELERLAL